MNEELHLSDWRPAAALIPGLVHFASKKPTFRPPEPVRRIRLFIPDYAKLRLIRMSIRPLAPDTLKGVETRQSSFAEGHTDASALLSGRHVHTTVEQNPFWEATFRTPIRIADFQITNLLGRGASGSYGLNVEVEDADGRIRRWANAGERTMRERLAVFSENVDKFLAVFPAGSPLSTAIERAASALAQLIAAADRAIASGIAPVAKGDARLRAIDAVTELVAASSEDRRVILLAAAPILDALSERRQRADESFGSCELDAVAIVAVAQHLTGSQHRRSEAGENGEFLGSPRTLAEVEERVNAHFLAAGGDPAQTPLIFRKHGLGGPTLLAEVDRHLDAIEEVATAMRDHAGFDCALCYGTLLGAVRERGFIAHDDDVDLAFQLAVQPEKARETLTRICATLGAAGIGARNVNGALLKVTSPATGIVIDVFPIFVVSPARVMMAMKKMKLRAVRRAVVLPFAPIEFYGRTFLAPAQPEAFLNDRYGKSWRIPAREMTGGRGIVPD